MNLLKNIKTTLFGSVAGISLVVDGIANRDWALIISGVGTILVGLFSKDHDTH